MAGFDLALTLKLGQSAPVLVEEFEHEKPAPPAHLPALRRPATMAPSPVSRRLSFIALEEAETALTFYAAEKERRAALVACANAAEKAAELARTRYRVGSANFLSVLDAERTLIEIRTALARSEAARASAEIDVFMAMDDGWTGTP